MLEVSKLQCFYLFVKFYFCFNNLISDEIGF